MRGTVVRIRRVPLPVGLPVLLSGGKETLGEPSSKQVKREPSDDVFKEEGMESLLEYAQIANNCLLFTVWLE